MNTIVRWIISIVRWIIEGWQVAPTGRRIGAFFCMLALIACIIAFAVQVGGVFCYFFEAISTPKSQRVRTSAWNKTQPLLDQAHGQAATALDKHLASIHAFMDERKAGCKAFAERIVSLRGKWELVKGSIGNDRDYANFLQEEFAEHIFPMEELEKAVAAAVQSYLAELESIDDDLFVRLRADLADDELPRIASPALSSDQALRNHYRELSQRVSQDLRADLAVLAGRELVSWPLSNIATDLTLKVGAALAARLGFSGTIFAAGANSTWQTLGVSLVVSFLLDAVIDRLMKAAGYDVEDKIAGRVAETFSALGRTITDGDPQARDTLEQLKTLQCNDPDYQVRAEYIQATISIEAGTQLYGLRGELSKIGAARASLRKETLRRLIQESE
jgi:hypothetical protein